MRKRKQIESKSVEVKPGRLYFAVGHVFDASQTNVKAEDLPRIFSNRWLEGSVKDYKSLYRGMEAVAEKNGVKLLNQKQSLVSQRCELHTNKRSCLESTKQ